MGDDLDLTASLTLDCSGAVDCLKQTNKSLGDTERQSKQVDKAMDDLGKSFKGLGQAALAVNQALEIVQKAWGAISGAVRTVTAAYGQQEKAETSLANALKLTGRYSGALMNDFKAFASQMQATTTVGDEAALQMLSVAKAMKLTDAQAKELVEASANLSAVTGKDLQSSFQQLLKSFGGMAGELGESLPMIRGMTQAQLMMGGAVKKVNEAFRGMAAGQTATFLGSMEQAANAFGDVLEEIGALVVEVFDVPSAAGGLVTMFRTLGESIRDFKQGILDVKDNALPALVAAVAAAMATIGTIFSKTAAGGALVALFTNPLAAIAALKAAFAAFAASVAPVVGVVAAVAGGLAALFVAVKELINEVPALRRAFDELMTALRGDKLDIFTNAMSALKTVIVAVTQVTVNLIKFGLAKLLEMGYEVAIIFTKISGMAGLGGNPEKAAKEIAGLEQAVKDLHTSANASAANMADVFSGVALASQKTAEVIADSTKKSAAAAAKVYKDTFNRQAAFVEVFGSEAEKAKQKVDDLKDKLAATYNEMRSFMVESGRSVGMDASLEQLSRFVAEMEGAGENVSALRKLEEDAYKIRGEWITATMEREKLRGDNLKKLQEKYRDFEAEQAAQLNNVFAKVQADNLSRLNELADVMKEVTKSFDPLPVPAEFQKAYEQILAILKDINKEALKIEEAKLNERGLSMFDQLLTKQIEYHKAMGEDAQAAEKMHEQEMDRIRQLETQLKGMGGAFSVTTVDPETGEMVTKLNADTQKIIDNMREAANVKLDNMRGLLVSDVADFFDNLPVTLMESTRRINTFSKGFTSMLEGGLTKENLLQMFPLASKQMQDMAANTSDSLVTAFEISFLYAKNKTKEFGKDLWAEIKKLRVSDIFKGAGQLLMKGAEGIAALFTPSNINGISDVLKASFSSLPNDIVKAFANLHAVIGQFIQNFPQVAEKVFAKLMLLFQKIGELLPKFIDAAVDGFISILDKLPFLIDKIADALPAAFERLLQRLPELILKLADAFTGIIGRLGDLIPDLVVILIKNAPAIIEALIEAAIGMMGDVTAAFVDFLIGGGLERIVVALIKEAPRIGLAIAIGFLKGVGRAFNAIMGQRLWDAGDHIATSIVNAGKRLQNIFEKITDSATDVFRVEDMKDVLSRDTVAGKTTALAEKVTGAFTTGANLLQRIVDELNRWGLQLKEWWDKYGLMIWNAFKPVFDAFIGLHVWVWNAFIKVVKFFTVDLINAVLTAFDPVFQLFSGLGAFTSAAFGWVIEGLGSVVWAIINAFEPAISFFRDAFGAIVNGSLGAIMDGMATWPDKVVAAVKTIGEAFSIDNLKAMGANIARGLWSWLTVDDLKSWGANIGRGLWNYLSVDDLKSWGANIAKGFVDGISGALGSLVPGGGGGGGGGGVLSDLGKKVGIKHTGGLVTTAAALAATTAVATSPHVQRFAGGGLVDSVPALLQPGEFVVRRDAVNALGTQFMQTINRGQAPGSSVTYQMTFNLDATFNRKDDENYIRSTVVPAIKTEIKQASMRGEFLMSSRGVRDT